MDMPTNLPDLQPVPFRTEGPQPLMRDIPPGAPYPVHALGPLRGAVEAAQGMTQAPVAIPAQSALSVASLAVQGHVDVETLGGVRPVSLYALTIARSGERKSSCDAELMRALRDHEQAQGAMYRDDMVSWRNSAALWKVQHSDIVNSAKGRQAKNARTQVEAEADLAALGAEPVAPPSPDRTVTEPTYEGLTRMFAEGMPSLGIFSDEGGQFLGGFAMASENRQKTLAALNDLWQGNAIRRTRQGEGSFTLYGRRLAVHLMVQPGVARSFMSDPMADDTGFLPRFLICEPASTIGTRLHGKATHDVVSIDAFGRRLRDILDTGLPMEPETRALEPRVIRLSPAARQMLIEYSDAIEAQQGQGGELANLTGHASKSAEHAARIAGVLTAWRDLGAAEISPDDMGHAIELAQYYLSEAVRLADAAKVSEETDRAERLRQWLLENWPHDEIITAEIVRQAPIRALRETDAANATLNKLAKHGHVVALPEGTVVRGAARKTAWRIVKGVGDVV